MNWKVVLFSLFLGFIYWSCDQDITSVGMETLPDQDKTGVYADTIYLDATTIHLDSIYAKTVHGLLGEFYDPMYGNLKSGYVCQFYPGLPFLSEVASEANDKIDSVKLTICYESFLGDSLAPMEASVFPVVKPLNKNYYTNMDPSEFCDLSTIYGKQTYTVRNLNLSDSLYFSSSIKTVEIRLADEIGQRLYDEWKKQGTNAFSSLDAFVNFFPGVYIKTTYGTGCIIKIGALVSSTETVSTFMDVYYRRDRSTKKDNGEDSVYVETTIASFNVTKEVIQLNSYQSSHDAQLLQPDNEKTHVKTPAGIFTKVIVPIPEIVKKMKDKKFTNAKFSISVLPQEDWVYALPFPGSGAFDLESRFKKLLLINADSITTFFESQLVADKKTAYTTTFNSANYTYNFDNIANVIQDAMDKEPDKNLELLVVPVVTSAYYSSSNGGYVDYSTSHFLEPSAVSLKKGGTNLKLEIIATDMNVDQLRK